MSQVQAFPPDLPGAELVSQGLADLRAARADTIEALLVTSAATRLRDAGIDVPDTPGSQAEHQLYDHLRAMHGSGAHARYTALRRRLASFAGSLDHARTR